jgi:hypothetical protein
MITANLITVHSHGLPQTRNLLFHTVDLGLIKIKHIESLY